MNRAEQLEQPRGSGQESLELIEMFDRGVERDPSAICLETADGDRRFSYGDVYELTHRLAVGLRRRGMEPGGRIAVLSPNDPLGFVAILAVLRLGCSWVPLNARSSSDDLIDLLDLCRCPMVLCHGSLLHLGEGLESPDREVIDFGDGSLADPRFESLLAAPAERLRREPAAERIALLMGTGGTTGRPKAVMLGHRQVYWQSLAFLAHMAEPRPPVQILAAPMSHAAGAITFPVLAAGGRTIVHDGVDPERIFESIQGGATRLYLPPTAVYSLLDHPRLGDYDFSSLEYFLYLAAPMSEARLEQAWEAFGPVMCQSFGQTEAPTICTWFSPSEHAEAIASESLRHRLRACGRQSVVAQLAIMGDDDRLLAAGEQGEIVVRGPLLMQGYLDDPEATARAHRAGWLATGDVGYRDDEGFYYIVDRSRDLIISGGFNVYPSEVERVLWGHDAVKDCAVIGVPDEKWGEAVTAVVELRDGFELDDDAVKAYCRQRLGPVKTPKQVLVEPLPRSANGKILKRELRDRHWAGRERLV